MNDAGLVRRGQSVRNLHGEVKQLLKRQRVLTDEFSKRIAFDQLRNYKMISVFGSNIEYHDDIRMVQLADCLCFDLKPLVFFRI